MMSELRPITARFGFLYLLSYFVIYVFPYPFELLPWTDGLFQAFYKRIDGLTDWVAVAVLHIDGYVRHASNGSGDTTAKYVGVLCNAVLALIAAAILTPLVHPRAFPRMHAALRLLLRTYLGWTMLSYGFSKVFKLQFSFPGPMRLSETYGHSSPMGLMWTFMGYSTPYTVFAGALESVGGVLVLFRRTTTLGALLLMGVMSNVVMMNFSFDVCVKLYSMHLLTMAIVLAVPDARRLLRVFVLNLPTEPPAEPRRRRWLRVASHIAQLLFVGYALYVNVSQSWKRWQSARQEARAAVGSPHQGAHDVEVAVSDRAVRWRVVSIRPRYFSVRSEDGDQQFYASSDDTATRTLTMHDLAGDQKLVGVLAYAPLPGSGLLLVGQWNGAVVTARMHKMDLSGSLLVNRGFHWINEKPFNH